MVIRGRGGPVSFRWAAVRRRLVVRWRRRFQGSAGAAEVSAAAAQDRAGNDAHKGISEQTRSRPDRAGDSRRGIEDFRRDPRFYSTRRIGWRSVRHRAKEISTAGNAQNARAKRRAHFCRAARAEVCGGGRQGDPRKMRRPILATRLVESMRAHFQGENFSEALVEAIEEAGKALISHFPKETTSTTAGRNCRRRPWKARASRTKIDACKAAGLVFISAPQRVFEVAPLVPGFPSLDVKPHSPGETR